MSDYGANQFGDWGRPLLTDSELRIVRREVEREAQYWVNLAMFLLATGVLNSEEDILQGLTA